jgi:hypothetical protein
MLDIQFIGPSLEEGPTPAVFYFALSAHDSLFLDPFNQPAVALGASKVRVFSATLPGHDTLPRASAIHYWADQIKKGNNPLDPFMDAIALYIQTLFDQNIITSCAVMGLSRGVFIAAHVAARLDLIQTILGFAPLTTLHSISEFHEVSAYQWDLPSLSEKLYKKKIRCYIGNRDTRVGTENCFNWLTQLANLAYEKGIRSPPIELSITPSIGKDGHGTSLENFQAGAQWLLDNLRGPDAS